MLSVGGGLQLDVLLQSQMLSHTGYYSIGLDFVISGLTRTGRAAMISS
jgi:hypothetical protein